MAAIELKVPDIGDFKDVEIIEVLVKPGDEVTLEQSLITVESDKASMEIPASIAGKIVEMKVKLGDKVSEGSVLALIEASAGATASSASPAGLGAPLETVSDSLRAAPAGSASHSQAGPVGSAGGELKEGSSRTPSPTGPAGSAPSPAGGAAPVGPAHVSPVDQSNVVKPHASPAVRMFARELGVDLTKVRGTGPKQRITMDDVRSYVKGVIAAADKPAAAAGDGAALGLIPWPKVDFAKFGPIEPKPLSRIKKLSGANLHRNWVMIPHVTNNDEADITDLEAFRVSLNKESDQTGVKYTMLGFLIKAVVAALKKHPEFNASLDGDQLVYKQYYHIGFAADTPNGLVVPVLKDADKKGLSEIAKETSDLAKKARDGKLSPADMQGGTFSISSLGGIGGTHFTPIINAPEVAILGVSKSYYKPVWNGKEFVPQLTLPLSLSYDHRVIDGAAAARFNNVLRSLLGDFRRAVL
ncbi:MAG: dihydrolipoyllysine-residue acetyltransferase [Burkholderiaceae bacterium]|nr:dihydrolipoyllysine-residue acetyltransferase [Burkholderiaceae bacterium]